MKIKIDTYYDITCHCCGRSWSSDFNERPRRMDSDGGMGMAADKASLSRRAYAAGWKCRNGVTLCPECLKTV